MTDHDIDAIAELAAPADVPDWRMAIEDEELRGYVGRFNTVGDLARGHLELRRKLSAAIVPPGKDADAQAVAEFRRRMGVPDSVDGYRMARPEGVPAEMFTDEIAGYERAFLSAMHKVGASQDVVEAAANWYYGMIAEALAARRNLDAAYADETKAVLVREWGPDYDRNLGIADSAARTVLGDEFEAFAALRDEQGRPLMHNPALTRAFARLGRELSEDGYGGALVDVPGGLEERIEALQEKRARALAGGDRRALERLTREQAGLYAQLHGDRPLVGTQGRTR